MTTNFKNIANGEAVSLQRIPHLSFDAFSTQALDIVTQGGKVVQFFAYPVDGTVRLMAVLRNDAREDFHTVKVRRGQRTYFGHEDRFLATGEHTYTFRYRASRMLGFFEDHDEPEPG